jgi:hypothetical protein
MPSILAQMRKMQGGKCQDPVHEKWCIQSFFEYWKFPDLSGLFAPSSEFVCVVDPLDYEF